jgi:hypothetical protein
MAGTNVEIIVPGYSTLFTRDLPYAPGVGEASDLNPFDPDSAAPLVEGEFLEVAASSSGAERLSRGANASAKPSYLYFMERGRYDAQLSRKAHVVVGPHGFIFRTKLIDGSFNIGDAVAPKTVGGKRVLAAYSTAGVYAVGYVVAKTSDSITVQYAPHKI